MESSLSSSFKKWKYILNIFLRTVTASLLILFGITDGQWTSKDGVRDADTDAVASLMRALNDGWVDPP